MQHPQSVALRVRRPVDETVPGFPGGSTMNTQPLTGVCDAEKEVQRPVWLELEVELHVDAGGHATGLRTVMPSGYGPFDRWALREIARATTRYVYPVPSAARLRYVVRGSYVAHVPWSLTAWFLHGHVEHEVKLIGLERDR